MKQKYVIKIETIETDDSSRKILRTTVNCEGFNIYEKLGLLESLKTDLLVEIQKSKENNDEEEERSKD